MISVDLSVVWIVVDPRQIAQSFYQELSGVYDDLSQGKEAAEIGWIAIDYLEQIPETYHNDGCGLYRGRLILPYEHLSRFQNDLID